MKKFEEPKLNVEVLDLEDVITTSSTACSVDGCTSDDCTYATPCVVGD